MAQILSPWSTLGQCSDFVQSLSFCYLKTELLDLLRPRTEAALWGGERGQGALGRHSLLLSVALLPFPRVWNSGVFLFLSY